MVVRTTNESRERPRRRRVPARALSAAVLLGLAAGMGSAVQADRWSGPSFREFSGVNQAGTTDSLYQGALGWDRHDLTWPSLEPTRGAWKTDVLTQCGQDVLALRRSGVTFLPMLGYTPDWAVAAGHAKDVPGSVTDWTDYITKAVRYLHASPCRLQYFQIWNEASPKSGFWSGTMDEYMTKIHLPAAAAIHAAGGKVVYGGWPCCESIPGLVDLLDRHHAWGSIDVLDVHYFNPGDLAALRAAADARGRRDLGIWQTEVGFTADPGYIADQYPRFLYWALTSHWDRPDKYKLFYFADWAPGDPAATWNYQHCLRSGSALNFHGVILQNLGALLGGAGLAAFPGVTSAPTLVPRAEVSESALEAFRVGRRVVIAVHLIPAEYQAGGAITLDVPVPRARITKAERVDLAGDSEDVTRTLSAAGTATRLTVAIGDAAGSEAARWNGASGLPRTFYARLTLAR